MLPLDERKAKQAPEEPSPSARPEDLFASVEIPKPAESMPESAMSPEQPSTIASQEKHTVASKPFPLPTSDNLHTTTVVPKDRLLQDIESAMEEDLKDVYAHLPTHRQKTFRSQGERAAQTIRVLVSSTKVHTRKIFQIILDWLKLIPGVSRFFLEQEAKIKTDKILLAAEEERRRGTIT